MPRYFQVREGHCVRLPQSQWPFQGRPWFLPVGVLNCASPDESQGAPRSQDCCSSSKFPWLPSSLRFCFPIFGGSSPAVKSSAPPFLPSFLPPFFPPVCYRLEAGPETRSPSVTTTCKIRVSRPEEGGGRERRGDSEELGLYKSLSPESLISNQFLAPRFHSSTHSAPGSRLPGASPEQKESTKTSPSGQTDVQRGC